MSISLKSFASFVAVIGISAVGAANTALASGQGSHGSGSHASNSHASSGSSHNPGSRSSNKFDRHDSYKFEHDRDRYRDWGRYNSWYSPFSYRSSYCYPDYCYRCYQPSYSPSYCCESSQYCSPSVCYQEPCYSYCPQPCYSCPEYCGNYCYPSYYGRNYWDDCFDRYKGGDHRKHGGEPKWHPESSKLSHDSHTSKSPVSGSPKTSSGIGQMGKVASRTSGISGGSHGSRR